MKGIVDSIGELDFEQGKLLLHLKFKYLIIVNQYNHNLCICIDKKTFYFWICIHCFLHSFTDYCNDNKFIYHLKFNYLRTSSSNIYGAWTISFLSFKLASRIILPSSNVLIHHLFPLILIWWGKKTAHFINTYDKNIAVDASFKLLSNFSFVCKFIPLYIIIFENFSTDMNILLLWFKFK